MLPDPRLRSESSGRLLAEGEELTKSYIGIVGLGVMGQMLALNMKRNGFLVSGFDLDGGKVDEFNSRHQGDKMAFNDIGSFIRSLDTPRRVMMMVPAGNPVDRVINDLGGALSPGDVLIDGGNSHFLDTERRKSELENEGIFYLGTGVSGGEYGARWGPSLMPGGPLEAWPLVGPVFEAISAKVNGEPCVAYLGPGGAGHYVKMVHNGIEYGDMQLIAESYDLLHRGLGLSNPELHEVYAEWNRGELESYLIEITADIFTKNDPETDRAIIDLILDEAKQKGTGKWTSQNSLDLGVPTPTINAAVESRIVSAYKDERVEASKLLNGPESTIKIESQRVIGWLRDALYAAKICSYAQGFALMRMASVEYEYDLNYGEIARIWRGGCIIRARFLNVIRDVFSRTPEIHNLMIDPEISRLMNAHQTSLRKVVMMAAESGIPVPAFFSALAYFDAYRSARLPANLTQAQRDYFGAHTYRRVDREGSFHTAWVQENAI
jgi:6-phosphogluconate dehydrogenase